MNWKYTVRGFQATARNFAQSPGSAKLQLARCRYPTLVPQAPARSLWRSAQHHQQQTQGSCCSGKRGTQENHGPPPPEALPVTRREFWASRPTWNRASLNTLRCLVGCTAGDFGAMWMLQMYVPDWGMGTIMGIASEFSLYSIFLFLFLELLLTRSTVASGISTSMILETVLLRLGRDGLSWPAAAKTAAGMSLISMITMEMAENAVDYYLTGGTVAFDSPTFWLAAVVSIGAGFLAPLPYNYVRLRKFGKACH